MYCVKPLDKEAIIKAAYNAKAVSYSRRTCAIWWTWFNGEPGCWQANALRKVINIALT